ETLVIGILRPKCLKNPRRDRAGSVNLQLLPSSRSAIAIPQRSKSLLVVSVFVGKGDRTLDRAALI
ncbi:hypothetical protein QUB70_32645, partial [Microcoleus sp. A003_D6]|uniref:hypothetical protein n=1 Tax=Microcoleus sp. A003_D6 TaxID=3055266 RepID=UPI002FCF0730